MIAVSDWDTKQVARWLETIGMATYSNHFMYHRVDGSSLQYLDDDDLREMGVHSIGARIKILCDISKVSRRPLRPVPDAAEAAERLAAAEEQVARIVDAYNRMRADLLPLFRRAKEQEPLPTPLGLTPSPVGTFAPALTPRPRMQSPASEMPPHVERGSSRERRSSRLGTNAFQSGHIIHADVPPRSQATPGAAVSLSTAAEPFKKFRVTMDDPCSKILPVVMRRYRIQDHPANYRLIVMDGTTEREVSDHEKPLLLFKELQDAGKQPTFMLRKILRDSTAGARTPGGII